MAIETKALSTEEIGKIEEEWSDSTVVKQLLGHIRYLTDQIIGVEKESAG